MRDTLSVIIATKDRHDFVKRCFDSLMKQSEKPDEVIVVDSSKNKMQLRGAKVFHKICNLSEGRSFGAKAAGGDILLFLDDDVVLDTEYIRTIKDFYESNPDCFGAEGAIANQRNRRIMERLFTFQSIGSIFLDSKSFRVRGLCGSNMSYRREVFNFYDFDTSIEWLVEDDDFSLRASKRFNFYYVSDAKVYHLPASTGGGNRDRDNKKMYSKRIHFIFRTFRNTEKKNILDFISFFMSNLVIFARLIKSNNPRGIKGVLDAYWSMVSSSHE